MRRLFALRDARIYLIGQALSSLGDTVMWLAMGIWVKTLTGSNGAAGLVFFAFAAPQLLAPLSGLLVDRLPRRAVLLTTNLTIGAVILALFAVRGAGQVWLIYLVMALYGVAYTVLSAGQTALLTQLVPEHLLADANGFLRTVHEGFRLFGPLLGAGLFAAFGGATVALVDAATFVAAAIALALLRVRTARAPARTGRWGTELAAGFRHLVRTPPLRQVFGACAVACLVIGVIESAAFAVVAGLHRPPTFIAVLVVLQGVGAVVAGSLAARVVRRIGEVLLTAAALAMCAVGIALWAVPSLAPVVVGGLVFGAGLPWLVVGPMTLLQRLTPGPLVGRVAAAADTVAGTPQTVSIAVGAALITVLDYRLLLVCIATVIAGAASYLLTRPRAAAAEAEEELEIVAAR